MIDGIPAHLAHIGKVSFVPYGYRDVIWCPYLNEPAIIEYRGQMEAREPHCPNCNGNYKPETHPFICHIHKPR